MPATAADTAAAHRDHRARPRLCRRHSAAHHGLAARAPGRCRRNPGPGAAGRPSRTRRDPEHQPVAGQGARARPAAKAWQTITWREGSADWLTSRFARVRVRAAHRDDRLKERQSRGMAADRMAGRREGADQILARQPSRTTSPFDRLVDLAKLRWRIERDYQELKQELGLGHYEGRGWRGFHHHATLCIAAYGFLISERETIPPSGPRAAPKFQKPAVPDRLPTPRRRRSGPSGTYRTRSPPCADASSSLSPGASTDVPAATRRANPATSLDAYDTVRLVICLIYLLNHRFVSKQARPLSCEVCCKLRNRARGKEKIRHHRDRRSGGGRKGHARPPPCAPPRLRLSRYRPALSRGRRQDAGGRGGTFAIPPPRRRRPRNSSVGRVEPCRSAERRGCECRVAGGGDAGGSAGLAGVPAAVRRSIRPAARPAPCSTAVISAPSSARGADLKLFVTASLEVRAARRLKELRERGLEAIDSRVLREMQERDARDSGRAVAPLEPASDAIVIDTSGLDPDAVFAAALAAFAAAKPPDDWLCRSADVATARLRRSPG